MNAARFRLARNRQARWRLVTGLELRHIGGDRSLVGMAGLTCIRYESRPKEARTGQEHDSERGPGTRVVPGPGRQQGVVVATAQDADSGQGHGGM